MVPSDGRLEWHYGSEHAINCFCVVPILYENVSHLKSAVCKWSSANWELRFSSSNEIDIFRPKCAVLPKSSDWSALAEDALDSSFITGDLMNCCTSVATKELQSHLVHQGKRRSALNCCTCCRISKFRVDKPGSTKLVSWLNISPWAGLK